MQIPTCHSFPFQKQTPTHTHTHTPVTHSHFHAQKFLVAKKIATTTRGFGSLKIATIMGT